MQVFNNLLLIINKKLFLGPFKIHFIVSAHPLPRDCIAWHSALPNYDDIVQYTFLLDIIGSAAMKKQLIDKNMN
jgi:hypothetical protein